MNGFAICADDYDADTGELYGFVNRSIPDAELDNFVDKFARRLEKFPKKVFDLGKEMVNARSKLPSKGDFYMSNFILNSVDSANDDIESYKRILWLSRNFPALLVPLLTFYVSLNL